MSTKEYIDAADKALLAELGYKQEFKREFKPLEVRLRVSLLTDKPLFSYILVGIRNRIQYYRSLTIHRVNTVYEIYFLIII